MTLPFIGDKLAVGHAVGDNISMQKKYGDIFGYWARKQRLVYVNSYELMQELGDKEEFSYR